MATVLASSVLFLVYALVTAANWRRCARGDSLAIVLPISDPGTLVPVVALVRRVEEWRWR